MAPTKCLFWLYLPKTYNEIHVNLSYIILGDLQLFINKKVKLLLPSELRQHLPMLLHRRKHEPAGQSSYKLLNIFESMSSTQGDAQPGK